MSDVAIVGGGPVGLFLALRLHQLGLRPRVYERRDAPRDGSRSIGIHPPSIERFDALGLGARLVEAGVRVRSGHAFVGREPAGVLDFAALRGPHRYVLTLPQHETEAILREAFEARVPGALEVGASVTGLTQSADGVAIEVERDGVATTAHAAFVVGCDGKRSAVRRLAGIDVDARSYTGRYAMCDAPDTTRFEDAAAIFVHPDGLVESFPLPGGERRWVVRRDDALEDEATLDELCDAVRARTGHAIEGARRFSGFGAERRMAARAARGRVALAGDAAHVVSPIGGQGMNLGWLGAWSLAGALRDALGRAVPDLDADAKRRMRWARAAARRAELNMWIGRPRGGAARRAMVRALLARPMSTGLARVFTMRGLGFGV